MDLNVFNSTIFLKSASYAGFFAVIYAETGLLVGLILPGESLLFTAGYLSSLGLFNIWLILFFAFSAAVLADSTGYALGKKYGVKIFKENNNKILNNRNMERAENFYNKHGGKTVILARFVPFARTVIPIMAGVGKMRYATFLAFNIIGALLWTISIALIGFYLGKIIPNAEKYIVWIILAVVLIPLIPALTAYFKKDRGKKLRELQKSSHYR